MKTKIPPPRGRLLALEGAGARLLKDQARRLGGLHRHARKPAGVSSWDASGVFFELEMRNKDVSGPSPKTLMLLFAADLGFRLRWEIVPLLEEGRSVVAAPYVESCIALGKAFGVSRRWLVDLFSFAPKAEACYRIDEPVRPSAGGEKTRGYVEHSVNLLNANSLIWDLAEVHGRVVAYLEALERRGGCKAFPPA